MADEQTAGLVVQAAQARRNVLEAMASRGGEQEAFRPTEEESAAERARGDHAAHHAAVTRGCRAAHWDWCLDWSAAATHRGRPQPELPCRAFTGRESTVALLDRRPS